MIVFELRMMGDAVMSLPFVRAAKEKYHVVVCCTPARREVYETLLPAAQVISWEPPWIVEDNKYALKRWRNANWRTLIRQLRAVRAEVTLTMWPDFRVHLLMALTGARQRIGYPMNEQNYYGHHIPERRKKMKTGRLLSSVAGCLLLRRLLTEKIDRVSRDQHQVENWRQMAESLSLPWDVGTPWIPPEHLAAPQNGAEERKGGQSWAWHIGARSAMRRWPVGKVESVVRAHFVTMRKPLLLIASSEDEVPPSLAELAPVSRPKSFRELCAVVNSVDVLICNDTGVAHVGAALGKRVVSIFSSGEPRWVAPFGNADLVVESKVCPHRPCYDRCVMPSVVCMEAVGTDLVVQKLTTLEGRLI